VRGKIRREPRLHGRCVIIRERSLYRTYVNSLVLDLRDKGLEIRLLGGCIDRKPMTSLRVSGVAKCSFVRFHIRLYPRIYRRHVIVRERSLYRTYINTLVLELRDKGLETRLLGGCIYGKTWAVLLMGHIAELSFGSGMRRKPRTCCRRVGFQKGVLPGAV
jgi:hypothetical protein